MILYLRSSTVHKESIYCDLTKAFDCLRYDILIEKLKFYGVEGKELNLIQSYLQNRTQVVSINGVTSTKQTLDIGVPQGSILGPVLFIVYINDLLVSLPHWADINLFADDTHVGVKAKSQRDLNHKIDNVTTRLKEWFAVNGIILNPQKTILMHYTTKKGHNVQRINEVNFETTTFLGYRINNTLSHSEHIDKICKKMASANYALLKLKNLLNKETLTSVYYAYVHSTISYALTVWGNATEIQKVLRMQKRSIRIICGLHKRTSAREYFVRNKIMTVISLYIFKSLLQIYSQKGDFLKNCDVHNYNTRNKEKIITPKTRLAKSFKQGIHFKILITELPATT